MLPLLPYRYVKWKSCAYNIFGTVFSHLLQQCFGKSIAIAGHSRREHECHWRKSGFDSDMHDDNAGLRLLQCDMW